MTSFQQFSDFCKMRHDYGDMIQVRYSHSSGEVFDTWVSGEEILQRFHSEAAEDRLRKLSTFDRNELRQTADDLPDKARNYGEKTAANRLAKEIEDFLGDNVISEGLADTIRGGTSGEAPDKSGRDKWRAHLQDPVFREKVVELAWIQLEGSFPEEESEEEPDDWI